MTSHLFRTAALGLLLAAGLSSAQAKKKATPPKAPKPVLTKAPKTCADQCEAIETICSDPCNDIKGNDAKSACKASCKDVADACSGSCKAKGKVDAQYMMERITPPKAPAGVKVKNDEE
ncbi:hypothetical protein [Vitiosangium sp. GDMCC 1.1324]|uniref:hypothetical protein n=1 Tax=Vitiosangium sp. (strain GDMCC 1.1324) TaxID=2138576 RepID=UPI000D3BC651|nr:hypothetical protein [Vitiosangium sp. GDMCC 1.1324]PTL82221.1 hypothetical protein DAT35_20750 [Vitiosangium sp. GDMCC 1.1324]